MKSAYFADKFASGLSYGAYLKTGSDEQRRRWKQVYDAIRLHDSQRQLVEGFAREMKILSLSGIWCGDCVQQLPLVARIAEANAKKIDYRIVDRDEHRDLADKFQINGGDRVPVLIFLAEDFEFCGAFGDRTIHRYRAIAHRQLGPACPTGIAPPETQELAATLGDWLIEIERVQLMLRLSPRLRQKHGD